jgi:hypothetical protein
MEEGRVCRRDCQVQISNLIHLMYSNYVRLLRGFDFPEKTAIDDFYPQYYHKCDKVP